MINLILPFAQKMREVKLMVTSAKPIGIWPQRIMYHFLGIRTKVSV